MLYPYFPGCVEVGFCELRLYGVLKKFVAQVWALSRPLYLHCHYARDSYQVALPLRLEKTR